jgi:hypothetical protein
VTCQGLGVLTTGWALHFALVSITGGYTLLYQRLCTSSTVWASAVVVVGYPALTAVVSTSLLCFKHGNYHAVSFQELKRPALAELSFGSCLRKT